MNASAGCNFCIHVIRKPLPNEGVCFLGNGWCSGLTGANGPHWLICNHNIGPFRNLILNGVELNFEDIVSLTCLSLFDSFTNAEDCLETAGLCFADLFCDHIISLSEDLPALRVTDKCPLQSEVDKLFCADFASEGTISFSANVLRRHKDI